MSMSPRSTSSDAGITVTTDTLGAFVRSWARIASDWHNAGANQVKHSYVTPALAECNPSTRISPLHGALAFAGPASRRGVIPVAYPRNLAPSRAGTTLSLALSMTHASVLCSEKFMATAAASAEDLPALMTVIAIVSAARVGAIESFSSAPSAENSDLAARYAAEYSSTVQRVVLRSSGANAAEDLWISAFKTNRKTPAPALPVLEVARKYGPLFVLLYAMLSEPGSTAVMGGMYANTVWAEFTKAVLSIDVDSSAFVLEPDWVMRAVVFEAARWIPTEALKVIAHDPAISTACMRRALTDPDAILASQEEEAHIRITADSVQAPIFSERRFPHHDRPHSPLTSDVSEEAVADDVFTSSTPAPVTREAPHQMFAFPSVPGRLAAPSALRPFTAAATTMVTPRPTALPGTAEAQFRAFAAQAARDAPQVHNDPYPSVHTPPPRWG